LLESRPHSIRFGRNFFRRSSNDFPDQPKREQNADQPVWLSTTRFGIRNGEVTVRTFLRQKKDGIDNSIPPFKRSLQSCVNNLCNRQHNHSENPAGSTADTAPYYLTANYSQCSRSDNPLHRGTHTAHRCAGPYGLP